jgi:hypothetical protein
MRVQQAYTAAVRVCPEGGIEMTTQVPPERLLELTETLVAAYNAKDFERLAQMLSPNLKFCHHNRGFAFDTRDEFIDVLRTFASDIVPDRRLGPAVRVIASGHTVLREQTWGGTARATRRRSCAPATWRTWVGM